MLPVQVLNRHGFSEALPGVGEQVIEGLTLVFCDGDFYALAVACGSGHGNQHFVRQPIQSLFNSSSFNCSSMTRLCRFIHKPLPGLRECGR